MSNALLIIILLYYYTDIHFNACVGIHPGMYTHFMLQLHDSRIEYERSLTDLHTQNIQKDREHHVEISDMTSRHEHMVNQLRDKHEQMIEQLKHNVRQIEHDNNVSLLNASTYVIMQRQMAGCTDNCPNRVSR